MRSEQPSRRRASAKAAGWWTLSPYLYATGDVTGGRGGGLAGGGSGVIRGSYATGTVTADSDVGGLVGSNSYGRIIASYSMNFTRPITEL